MNRELQGRPKPKFGVSEDIEDEMLQYQELFRRSNMEPAAQVIREPKTKRQQSDEENTSSKRNIPVDLTQTTVMRPLIVERDVSSVPIQLPQPVHEPFPQAKHRGQNNLNNIELPHVKKASLFAKQMFRDGKLQKCRELEASKSKSTDETLPKSVLLTGHGLGEMNADRELERIHHENLDRLQSLEETEILAEKERLLNSLDPKLISFIRQRHKNNKMHNDNQTSNSNQETVESNSSKTSNTDLPFEIDSRWVHMDKVEHEKLEWMKDLPTPSATHKTNDSNSDGVPARFDFKGNLLSPTEDIPVTAALHHHGEDPEAPGYTLDELFHLCRSTVLQQRVISLQTLANIIRRAHAGAYDISLQLPLIPKLIEAGIVFLIRWAMDEQIETVYMVAIDCLASLVAPKHDEKLLSETMHWPCGYFQPLLTPPELQLGEKRAESDLTDLEILEQDVIKCLFRMNILKRTVYLLERMRALPSSTSHPTVKSLFHILIRMARHSMNCANQIFSDRQLMDFIIKEFIPEIAVPTDEKSLYGRLLPEALKLCQVLASSGPALAINLINQYNMNQRLQNHFVSAFSIEASLAENQTLPELLALWRVFILQGHLVIDFGSLIPMIVLPLCRACIQQMPNRNVSQILVQLLTLIDSLIIRVTKFIVQNRNTPQSSDIINWSHIDGLFDIIVTIGKQSLIITDEKIDFDALHTACLSCLASFLIGQQILTINLLDLPIKVETITTKILKPILNQRSTQELINNMTFESASFSTNSCANLPSLTQKPISPFGFLTALLRLTNIIYRINKHMAKAERLITKSTLSNNSEILVYIKKMLTKLSSIGSRRIPWFEHFEHLFIFEFIQVIYQENPDDTIPSIYYELLLSMLPSLLSNDQYLAQEILRFIFFDGSFWKRSDEINLNELSLDSNEALCLASNESIVISANQRNSLYERAIEHLPSLFSYYQNILRLNRPSIEFKHCDIHFGNFFHSEELLKLIVHYSNPLIDPTWPYGLLSSLVTNTVVMNDDNKKLDLILNTLRFVYVLENKKCLGLLKQLSITTRFSMIAGVYLLGSDIFLDKDVAEYLVAFMNLFHQQNILEKLDTRSMIQSLMTFSDFYRLLIDQYDACSFGDVLFSNYIIVPLQQKYGIHLRKHVWMEHSTVLNSLRLKPDQILHSLGSFFVPYESDLELILCYAQNLLDEKIRKESHPFLYMIAVHHLNAFLFDQTKVDQLNLQKSIIKKTKSDKIKEKSFVKDIFNYKTFSKDGLVLYNSLPTIRINWLEKLEK